MATSIRQMAEVINRGDVPVTKTVNGEAVTIAARAKITLGRKRAREFMGIYHPLTDEKGQQLASPLEIRLLGQPGEQAFISQKTGEVFNTQAELLAHLKQFESEVLIDKNDKIEEKKSTTTPRVYCCLDCDFETMAKKALLSHVRAKHGNNTAKSV